MGYQPKSYRKFLSASVSAAVVATALAPVAASAANTGSFSDVPAANQAQVSWAVSQGIVKGYADNTFKPFDKIDRTHAAVMLANALNLTIPTSVSAAPFADVPADSTYAPYIQAVKDAGVFKGSNGYFHGSQVLTREQMAAVLVNAYNLQDNGKNVMVADKAEADAYAQAPIQTLADLGITVLPGGNFNPKGENARIHLVSFLYQVNQYMMATPSIDSVSATGAKELTVDFNKAVDASKAVITVSKGSVSVNVDSVTFSDDKTTATIDTTAKLTKGDYTVNVTGLTDTALTKTVTVADETLSKIIIKSDTAPLNSASATINSKSYGADETALVKYQALNQYGEEMPNQSITWTQSTGGGVMDDGNGNLTIANTNTVGTAFVPGAKVYLTGVQASTGTVVNGEVTIGLESKANTVAFKGVYNTSTKQIESLPAGFDSNKYVLLFQVKDQYGNDLSLNNFSDLVFTSDNPLFVSSSFSKVSDVTIDGTTYQAVALSPGSSVSQGGTAHIQVISKVTGQSSSYSITANALPAVKTLSISAPASIVAEGEKVEVPFTAVDQYGNPVTNYDTLVANVTPNANNGTFAFEKQNDGSAKLYYTAPMNSGATTSADAPEYLTTLVGNGGNFSSLMINVKAKAVPTAIIGLDSTKSTSIATGNNESIQASDLIVQDQYGRTMSDSDFATWLGKSANNSVVVASEKPASNDVSPFTVSLNSGSDKASNVIATTSDNVVVSGKTTANINSSENISFALSTDGGTTSESASTKTFSFNETSQANYASYEVDDLGTMYYDRSSASHPNHDVTVNVYGVEQDGTKVLLPTTDYSVALNNVALQYNSGKIVQLTSKTYLASDFTDTSGNAKTVKVPILVTVNDSSGAAAKIIQKDLLLSDATPVGTTITTDSDLVTNGNANITSGAISHATLDNYIYEVKDQYGVDKSETPAVTITNLTKVSGSSFQVANNGTTTASISGAAMGDKFTATYKYTGGDSVSIDFTVGLDTVAPVVTAESVTGSTLTLTYSESLDSTSVPATADYQVNDTTATSTDAVTNVSVSGNKVVLTLTSAPTSGDTITVDYTPGTNKVKDSSANLAVSISGATVTNNN